MKHLKINCTKNGIRVYGANNIGSTCDTDAGTRQDFMRVAEHWWNTYYGRDEEALAAMPYNEDEMSAEIAKRDAVIERLKVALSGDAAKLRKALIGLVEDCENLDQRLEEQIDGCYDLIPKYLNIMHDFRDRVKDAQSALAAPPRNCDVGSTEEQTARYRKFCSAHKYLGSDFSHVCKGFGKGRCPFFNSHAKSQCEFAWAQMPYEKGGAK